MPSLLPCIIDLSVYIHVHTHIYNMVLGRTEIRQKAILALQKVLELYGATVKQDNFSFSMHFSIHTFTS